jgi:hypothetical protein
MKKTLAVVVLTLLALIGCTSSQILTTLEASVAAAEALVVTLTATGNMDPVVAAEITAAIVDLPRAFQGTSVELATTDPPAIKYSKIALLYAPTLANLRVLPPAAQAIVSTLVAAIEKFLQSIAPPVGLQAGRSSPAFQVGQYKHLDERIFALTDKIGSMQNR